MACLEGHGQNCPQITRERKCWTLFSATILAGALSGSVIAQTPDAGCALPSEPQGIPAARCVNPPGPRGQASRLHEGPVNTRSAHDVPFNRRGRFAEL